MPENYDDDQDDDLDGLGPDADEFVRRVRRRAEARRPRSGGAGGGEFAQALKVLSEQFNCHLPPGTTPANVFERICLIGHQKQQSGKGAEDAEDADVEEAKDTQPVMMSTQADEDEYRSGLRRGAKVLGRRAETLGESAEEKAFARKRAANIARLR
jgi:hypothetical protein